MQACQIVQVNDPFESSFIAVFDRNYFYDRLLNTSTPIKVQSLWSPELVWFLLITRDRDCLSHPSHDGIALDRGCSSLTNTRNIVELFVKINDDMFQVAEENSTFPVSNELAQGLQNSTEGNISI